MAYIDRYRDNRESNLQSKLDALVKIRNRPRSSQTKLLKAGTGTTGAIAVTPNLIDLSVPSSNDGEPLGVSIIQDSGIVIRGPVGFTESPEKIRIAGLWTFNNLLLSAAPSTILTPIPVMRFSLPLENLANHAKSAATIAALGGIL